MKSSNCLYKKRLIHDAVHGSFYLPHDIWRIIDTPEFQRLRDIKQTGNSYLVYMCANHTRFEHSLAVAYLCGVYGRKILSILNGLEDGLLVNESSECSLNQKSSIKELFNQRDIFVLQVAGLCHDLGHACFSHLFDNVILPALNPDKVLNFKHETASFLILERINQRLKILTEEELTLVGKLIYGSSSKVHSDLTDRLKWTDKDYIRTFMFQILSNEIMNNQHHCSHLCNNTNSVCNGYGVDVDKFDYIKRDGLFTGVKTTFDCMRLIELCQIYINEQDHYILSYDKKAHELIRSMWTDRNDLHRRVYQHKTVKCIDAMYTRAFIASAPYLNFKSEDTGLIYNIKDIYQDMSAYCQLTDKIIHTISELVHMPLSRNPDIHLINRVKKRQLWKLIHEIRTNHAYKSSHDTAIPDELKEVAENRCMESNIGIDNVISIEVNLNGEYIYYLFDTSTKYLD